MFVLMLLAACLVAAPTGVSAAREHDGDGDGVLDDEDCAPTDPARHAGAVDVCNGLDDDCDYVVDEDAAQTPWYWDPDADLYGDATVVAYACTQPDLYVEIAGDCDSHDGEIHPGAVESCDDVDSDCDGDITDVPEGEGLPWYADADGDGFGDTLTLVYTCFRPDGYIATPGDCDDTDAAINPRAAEICDDADVDENCDGFADEADSWVADGDPYFEDLDGDGFGSDTRVWRCALGPGASEVGGDCDDADPDTWPGAPDACWDAVDADCDGVDGTCL
jgi:hypothetical protein